MTTLLGKADSNRFGSLAILVAHVSVQMASYDCIIPHLCSSFIFQVGKQGKGQSCRNIVITHKESMFSGFWNISDHLGRFEPSQERRRKRHATPPVGRKSSSKWM